MKCSSMTRDGNLTPKIKPSAGASHEETKCSITCYYFVFISFLLLTDYDYSRRALSTRTSVQAKTTCEFSSSI